MTATLGLPDLIDGLGRTFVGRQPREPRAKRTAALPEFQPRVLKIHDRVLQVERKFGRNARLRLTSTATDLQRFTRERREMVLRALVQGWTVAEVLDAMEEAYIIWKDKFPDHLCRKA